MDEVLLSSFEGSTTGHGHGHAVIASFSQAIVAPSRTTLEDYLAFLAQQGAASMKEVVQGMQQLHTQTLNLTQKDLYGNRERQSHLARGIQICRDQFRTAKEILEHLRRGIVNEVKSITQVGPELIDWIQATAKTTEVILRKLLHTVRNRHCCSFIGGNNRENVDGCLQPLIRDYSDLIPTLSWLSVDFIYIFLRIRRKLILSESEQHYKRNIDQCLDTITSLLWSGLYHRNLIIPVLAWKPPIATQEDAFTTLFEYVSVVAQTTTKSWIVDPKQRDFDSNLSDKRVTTVCGALASLVSVATDTKNGDRNSESNAVDDDTAYQFMELVKK